jgi:rRNA-processing protein FCF1
VPRILIDACGWAALVDASINIDLAFSEVTGPAEFVATEGVIDELNRLATQREGLLLDLLLPRCEVISNPAGVDHVDDGLLKIAYESGIAVLTVDRRLKQRLAEAGCAYVEVTASRTLRLVD